MHITPILSGYLRQRVYCESIIKKSASIVKYFYTSINTILLLRSKELICVFVGNKAKSILFELVYSLRLVVINLVKLSLFKAKRNFEKYLCLSCITSYKNNQLKKIYILKL